MNKLNKYFTTTHIASYRRVGIPTTINWMNQGILATFKTSAGHNHSPWRVFINILKEHEYLYELKYFGNSLLQNFREKNELTHVSIYIVSAYIDDDLIQELNDLNISVILNKPMDHKQLMNRCGLILA